jgi:hypothetical protein
MMGCVEKWNDQMPDNYHVIFPFTAGAGADEMLGGSSIVAKITEFNDLSEPNIPAKDRFFVYLSKKHL